MINFDNFRKIALSFAGTTEQRHFDKISFRTEKRIFATYDAKTNQASIKLSEIDQSSFSTFSLGSISAVPNKWGKQGWTRIDLDTVDEGLCSDAIKVAYEHNLK